MNSAHDTLHKQWMMLNARGFDTMVVRLSPFSHRGLMWDQSPWDDGSFTYAEGAGPHMWRGIPVEVHQNMLSYRECITCGPTDIVTDNRVEICIVYKDDKGRTRYADELEKEK